MEVVVRGVKRTFSATGHTEERLKTLRKREPPEAKKYPPRKAVILGEVAPVPSDNSEG